jgi:hypothetical protein
MPCVVPKMFRPYFQGIEGDAVSLVVQIMHGVHDVPLTELIGPHISDSVLCIRILNFMRSVDSELSREPPER